jgi:hypothetical protein
MIHEWPNPELESERVGTVEEESVASEAGGVPAEEEMADAEGETADGCCRGSKS